jgi:biopolymer transport protein ExbB
VDRTQAIGLAHFLTQADIVGKTVLVVLLAMSVASWYLIVTKTLQTWLTHRRTMRFLEAFWNAPSLQAVAADLEQHRRPDEPFSHLAWHAVVAARHHERHGAKQLKETGSAAEFLTRSMRRVIDEETARLAPFVGLFGTVWGVYRALVGIGLSGQGTLDKVAGPVGEALIMTAAGLAVAVPAVLAYNAFVRSNRVVLARLDAFAHDLFAFLTTGSHVNEAAAVAPLTQTLAQPKGAA